MRGASFQKPLELGLRVEGESWRQGDLVRGELVVKNHGAETVPLREIQVRLAHGGLKRVHEKAPDAFDLLSSAEGPPSASLEPGKEATFPWSFQTDRNCPITDSSSSLFLLYGRGEALETLGQLQLLFHPDEIIQEFLNVLGIHFRFVVKTQKATKRGVDVKLVPPAGAKAFGGLEHLVVSFKFEEGDALRVLYAFHMKKLEPSAAALSLEVKKQKSEVEQTFVPAQYRVPSGRINHELLEQFIGEALKTGESKTI